MSKSGVTFKEIVRLKGYQEESKRFFLRITELEAEIVSLKKDVSDSIDCKECAKEASDTITKLETEIARLTDLHEADKAIIKMWERGDKYRAAQEEIARLQEEVRIIPDLLKLARYQ
jgi:hypothetical protein